MMTLLRNFFVGLSVLALAATAALGQTQDQRIWGGTSTGSSPNYVLSIANYDAYRAGTCVFFLPNFSNPSAATVNIDSLGAKNIFKPTAAGAVALTGGELVASPVAQIAKICYDGTQFQIISNTNASALQVATSPQGYLTPCQVSNGSPATGCSVGQIVPSGDVTSVTNLYYEPFNGNQIPIWNGSNMVQTTFGELTIAIPSSRLANTIYDAYVFSNAGVVTGCIGVAWTTSTPGSGARGSGAGTAQIVQQNGVWTNAVSLSCVNGASTYTIPANQGTVVGTVLIDGTNGQVSFTVTWGQSRKWSVWNFYNQQPIIMAMGDSTASWNYSTNTIRQSNGSASNKVTMIVGLPNQKVEVEFNQLIQGISDGNSDVGAGQIGAGLNSTTVFSGTYAQVGVEVAAVSTTTRNYSNTVAQYEIPPFIGANVVNALENSPDNGSSSTTYFGTEAHMRLKVRYGG